MKKTIKESYLDWLKERIWANEFDKKHYSFVLAAMFNTEAFAMIGNDDGQLENGVYNRILFGASCPWFTAEQIEAELGPCNLLELGYSLAQYTNSQIIREETYWDGTHEVFWEFIENIGLDRWTDRHVATTENGPTQVMVIIERLNERRYEPDGDGNWFRLNQPRDGQDLRLIDWIFQSWAYVNEGQTYRWR